MMQRFNEWLAGRLADWLSTMICFYVVSILVVSILYWQTPKSSLDWIQYIIQTFFQGVALPVLAFVAKKEGTESRKLAQETHDTVMQELQTLKEVCSLEQDIKNKFIGGAGI